MFLSSSRLCFDVTEKTRMNAWPLEMERRCMAGNCCVPVVSVMCIVQIELFEDITCEVGYGEFGIFRLLLFLQYALAKG